MRDITNEKTSVKNRLGFRKLSVDLTTVFLGSIFFLSSGQSAHTAEVGASSNADGEATTEVVQSNDKSTGEQSAETDETAKQNVTQSSESTEKVQNDEQKNNIRIFTKQC